VAAEEAAKGIEFGEWPPSISVAAS
jgi:hypothetical protein